MRAARLPSTGAHLVVEEIPDPTPGPGQVVVKIAASGVCHSDVTIQNAGPGMPPVPYFPWTPGHENTGYVHALGDGVTGFEVGDAVAVWQGWGDGTVGSVRPVMSTCPNVSYVGVTQPGGWADCLLVSAAPASRSARRSESRAGGAIDRRRTHGLRGGVQGSG